MFGEILWMLIIPAIALGLMIWLFHAKVTWKEAILQFAIPSVICVVVGTIFYFAGSTDIEYLNSYAITAHYEEPWNELVTYTETETYTDSKGNTQTRTVTKTRVDNHGPEWYVRDNCGDRKSITQGLFNQLVTRWNNKSFKDMHRDYHTRDGDMYITTFNNNFDDLEPFTWKHMYKNKVQNSKSVFSFVEVDKDDVKFYGLYDYNDAYSYDYEPIYGWADKAASDQLKKLNAWYGKRRQLQMNLLVFPNKSMESATYQEAYWTGGNKNEFNVCIGLKGQTIEWVKVISWTEVDILKIETQQDILAMGKFDAEQVVNYMGEKIPPKWKRKEFADFDYLSVEISLAGKITTFVLVMTSTIGMCIVSHRMDIR